MKKTDIRWLVLGCGGIARKFVEDMPFVSNGTVAAVASRSIEKAAAFASEYAIDKHYGSYAEAAADVDIDAVYIATPHPMHLADALMCIENGKAVLCEKPLVMNARQGRQMVDAARKNGVFLMEAMWTRFVPATKKFMELIKGGALGKVNNASLNFGFHMDVPQTHRIYNPELGGGALLDIGIYAASMASLIFKKQPREIASRVVMGPSGVDINDSISFDYGDGRLASIELSCSAMMPVEVTVFGEKGYMKLCRPFYCSEKIELCTDDKTTVYDIPVKGGGYCYEIEHVGRCISEGKSQSEIMPQDESLEIMETLDRIRAGWGLVYPCEK